MWFKLAIPLLDMPYTVVHPYSTVCLVLSTILRTFEVRGLQFYEDNV